MRFFPFISSKESPHISFPFDFRGLLLHRECGRTADCDWLAARAGFLYSLSFSSAEEGCPRGVLLVVLQGFLNYKTVFSGMLMIFSNNLSKSDIFSYSFKQMPYSLWALGMQRTLLKGKRERCDCSSTIHNSKKKKERLCISA